MSGARTAVKRGGKQISWRRKLYLARVGLLNYYRKRPFAISFEVTHSCNSKCKHCHLNYIIDEALAPPKKFGAICRELKPVVAQASGGEPLLRADLEQIIEAFRVPDRPPYITVTTNGSLLTKGRYRGLIERGVDECSV